MLCCLLLNVVIIGGGGRRCYNVLNVVVLCGGRRCYVVLFSLFFPKCCSNRVGEEVLCCSVCC